MTITLVNTLHIHAVVQFTELCTQSAQFLAAMIGVSFLTGSVGSRNNPVMSLFK